MASELLRRGHVVRALVRPASEGKLPSGCDVVPGDPLDAETFRHRVAPADTFVQLVGVSHPSPSKAALFRSIDLASARASVGAAAASAVEHFIYVSVAHPAPVMRAYVEVRREAEELIRTARLNAAILRSWYVLGPGHWWPAALLPAYWLMERLPSTCAAAGDGLVTIDQMVRALVHAVEHPCPGVRTVDVPMIRRGISVE